MNLFDIVGPVMVGPSSSHTEGRNTRPAKKYNIIASIDEFFQFFCAIHTNHPFIPKLYDARGKISYTAL